LLPCLGTQLKRLTLRRHIARWPSLELGMLIVLFLVVSSLRYCDVRQRFNQRHL
jgi:hypothetical protein